MHQGDAAGIGRGAAFTGNGDDGAELLIDPGADTHHLADAKADAIVEGEDARAGSGGRRERLRGDAAIIRQRHFREGAAGRRHRRNRLIQGQQKQFAQDAHIMFRRALIQFHDPVGESDVGVGEDDRITGDGGHSERIGAGGAGEEVDRGRCRIGLRERLVQHDSIQIGADIGRRGDDRGNIGKPLALICRRKGRA